MDIHCTTRSSAESFQYLYPVKEQLARIKRLFVRHNYQYLSSVKHTYPFVNQNPSRREETQASDSNYSVL